MNRLDQLITVLTDVRHLGARFAVAALTRWRRQAPFPVVLAGIGPVWVRGRDSDIDTLRGIFLNRDYEIPSAPVRDRLAERYQAIVAKRKRAVIVDAGANIGGAALWFARLYPDAVILAVEPDPTTLAMLKRNVAAFPNIRIVAAALGSTAGRVRIVAGALSDATRTERADDGTRVTTVSELLDSVEHGEPFIAKIDIEGFEADVFAANTDWIGAFPAIFTELHDWMLPGQRSSGAFQTAMAAHHDFEIFVKGENLIYVRR